MAAIEVSNNRAEGRRSYKGGCGYRLSITMAELMPWASLKGTPVRASS